MSKKLVQTLILFFLIGSFVPVSAQRSKQNIVVNAKPDLKFLDIVIDVPVPESSSNKEIKSAAVESISVAKKVNSPVNSDISLENANSLQFKYAVLMNLEVEQIQNLNLFKLIDEWIGTRYKLGGCSKYGIDCSAFMQVIFASIYGISLPRTAKEQYNLTRRISRTELKEGDLVFFNTVGGVSHVGMYLQNNKFVHASSSGVTISDLYDDYWARKFIGVGRLDGTQALALVSIP
ncbi:MAG TPA: C40 family peptidase [Flavisolibacter sp.]|nr:C40 family peptidase [Flavisolibacter sp.]